MTVATIDKDGTFLLPFGRTTFPASKRILAKETHHAQYVPSNQLPEEVKIKISPDTIEFVLMYSISEPSEERRIEPDIDATIGRNTERIFNLKAGFSKGDYSAMINRLDDIKESLVILKKNAVRPVSKKTYDLLIEIVNVHKTQIEESKQQIQAMLTNTETLTS